ncbi:hypothetical protein DITRI_Ditri05aG0051900 [Diplodiscus trichospermus]
MDPHQFLGGKRRGYSKAQMCLQKILAIICSISPPQHQQNSKPKPSFHHLQVLDSSPFGHQDFHIDDLNVELTSSPETENSSFGMDSTEHKSNQEKSGKEDNSFEKKRNPVSETDDEDGKNETEPLCKRESEQEKGCSPLLAETGEQSSENGESERGGLGSDLGTEELNGKGSMKEGRERWVVDLYGRFDEISQVVRTKRGRKRVLPCRYKDSVLQPLVRNAGSRKRQRF